MSLNPFESPDRRTKTQEERAKETWSDLVHHIDDYNPNVRMTDDQALLLLRHCGEEGRDLVEGEIGRGRFDPSEEVSALLATMEEGGRETLH